MALRGNIFWKAKPSTVIEKQLLGFHTLAVWKPLLVALWKKTAWLWSQPDRGGKTLEEVTAAPEGKDALQSDVFTCAQALSCWVLEDDGLPGVFRGQAATWLDGECTSVSPGLPAKNRTKASRSYNLVFQSWLNTFLPPWKHCFLKNMNFENRNLRNTHCNNRKLENLFCGCSLIWSTGCCRL